MKMNKYYALAAFASLALASCNNDDNVDIPLSAGHEIRFGAQTITADTKAPFDGTISATNKLTAHIIGSETTNNYTTIYKDDDSAEAKGDITFEANGTTEYGFSSGVKWKDASTTLYFRGFYPAGSIWTLANTSATASVDGKTDLMLAPEVSGQQGDGALNFAFGHLLTKLHVKVIGNATTATDWGTISKIELSKALNANPKATVSQTFSDPAASFSGTGTIPFYLATEDGDNITYTDDALDGKTIDIPATGSAVLTGYSLVAPVEAVVGDGDVKDEYTLKVYTSVKATAGKEVAINLKGTDGSDFVGSTAGKKFDITIQFRGEGQITATATVTDWVDGGSGNGQM